MSTSEPVYHEPASTSDSKRAPPVRGSRYLDQNKLDWEHAGTDGFWLKRLHEDPERGEKTWLMRVDPGASAGDHAHEDYEQIYVISGRFSDGERTLGPGSYCCRAPGAMHSTRSDEGAVVLLIYSRAVPVRA